MYIFGSSFTFILTCTCNMFYLYSHFYMQYAATLDSIQIVQERTITCEKQTIVVCVNTSTSLNSAQIVPASLFAQINICPKTFHKQAEK